MRYTPDGKYVIIIKNRSVGRTASMLPILEYEIEEGGKKYFVNEYDGGDTFWYLYDELHRELGPAAEWANGEKTWYFHGERMNCKSQEEFIKHINLKAFW